MQDNFLMLPNNLVWNYWERNNTYLKQYGDKIIHIFSYLDACTNKFNRVVFNIKDLITAIDMSPKSGKGKVNEQFKTILEYLKVNNILVTNINFNKIDIGEYVNCIFNMPFEKDNYNNIFHFFTITINNYLTIINDYKGRLNKLILLKVYFYINARISRRIEDVKNIIITGGKANCFYDSMNNISNDLSMSKNTWDKYTKELKHLGLIDFNNIGKVKKNKKIINASNVYVVNDTELEEGLKQSKLYYKEQGYQIIKNNNKNNLTKIN